MTLSARITSVALLGAHPDDIAIGAGATLLTLARACPGLRVEALVLTGAGTSRAEEEASALAAFCPGARLDLHVADLADGRVVERLGEAKTLVAGLRGRIQPDLVLAPQRHDRHQDHRALAELVGQEFRHHLLLGYEIVKYEDDLPRPQLHVPVSEAVAAEKIDLLHEHYPSQHSRSWFDRDVFAALMRLRGVGCQQRWAEAFVAEKVPVSIEAVAAS